MFVINSVQNVKGALKLSIYADVIAQRHKININKKINKNLYWSTESCDVLSSSLMSFWHSGQISIQRWRTPRSSQVWRRSKKSSPFYAKLDTTVWHIDRVLATQYCTWAPSPSWLHSVTPAFQLLISGAHDLNILPYTVAAITFRRRPLNQTVVMTAGSLTARGGADLLNLHLLLHTVCMKSAFVHFTSISCHLMQYISTFITFLPIPWCWWSEFKY